MVAGFGLLLASAVLLTVGAELFAEHTAQAARWLGVSTLAVGLLLAGAEPEELITAAMASAQHHPGIAAGDAIGANVTMLTLVIGLAAVLRPLPFHRRVWPYALAASGAGAIGALALSSGHIGRPMGAGLVAAYAVAVTVIWRRERRPPAFGEAAEQAQAGEAEAAAGDDATRPGWRERFAPGLVLLGLAGMALGGRLAVAGAVQVVGALGLRESVVGLTFVALATTAELLALVWAAARRGLDDLALAGVLGSAVYNATATLGTAALVRPLAVAGVLPQAWLAAAVPLGLLLVAHRSGRLTRGAGLGLLAAYGAFLAFTFTTA